jgi:hypothetical protein
MSYSVFISHSSKNSALAKELCRLLEASQVTCWIAPRDIPLGASYGEVIATAIENVSVVVLLLTQPANDSRAVANELELGFRYQKTIVPIRVSAVEPSKSIEFFVSNAQWVDAITSPLKKRVVEVVRIVKAIEQGIKIPSPPPEVNSWLSRIERFLEQAIIHKFLTAGIIFIFIFLSLGLIYLKSSATLGILQTQNDLIQHDPATYGLVNLHPSSNADNDIGLRVTFFLNLKNPTKLDVKYLAIAQNSAGKVFPVALSSNGQISETSDPSILQIHVPNDTTAMRFCIQAMHPGLGSIYVASWTFSLNKTNENLQISRVGQATLLPITESSCESTRQIQ